MKYKKKQYVKLIVLLFSIIISYINAKKLIVHVYLYNLLFVTEASSRGRVVRRKAKILQQVQHGVYSAVNLMGISRRA